MSLLTKLKSKFTRRVYTLLCPRCAQADNRHFYDLIYSVRGAHTCEKCGAKFKVENK